MADAADVDAGRRDGQDQRLRPRSGRCFDDVPDRRRLLCVEFVLNGTGDVEPVQAVRVRRLSGINLPACRRDRETPRGFRSHPDAEILAERRRPLRHLPRNFSHDLGLIPRRRHRVALRPGFAVRRQHVQGDDRAEHTLSIFARYQRQGDAEPPQACLRMDPAEDRRQEPALPRLEHNRRPDVPPLLVLPGNLRLRPADMRQHLGHLTDPPRGIRIEPEREPVRGLPVEIASVAGTGQADPFARRHDAREHVRLILRRQPDVILHPFTARLVHGFAAAAGASAVTGFPNAVNWNSLRLDWNSIAARIRADRYGRASFVAVPNRAIRSSRAWTQAARMHNSRNPGTSTAVSVRRSSAFGAYSRQTARTSAASSAGGSSNAAAASVGIAGGRLDRFGACRAPSRPKTTAPDAF